MLSLLRYLLYIYTLNICHSLSRSGYVGAKCFTCLHCLLKYGISSYELNLRLLKKSYSIEPYMKYHLNKRQRSLCAQLCSGTLPLAREAGRFNATAKEDRLSFLCEHGEIENVVYYFFCLSFFGLNDF